VGAQRKHVLQLVLRDGMVQVFAGMLLGTAAALAASKLMASLLFQVQAADPGTYVTAAVLLALVALVASYLPARRAMQVDPMAALREE
jgi:putative ABC transport system permease protein